MVAVRPGLCSITFRDLSVDEVAEHAARCGLEGIEWGADRHVPPGDREAITTARDACERNGLEIPSYGSYLIAGTRSGPDDVIEAAVGLTAKNVRIWAGAVASADCSAEDRHAVVEDIARWCDAAADHDLTISLECHAGTLTDTADSVIALLSEVDRPNLWTYWQPRDRGHDAGDEDLTELDRLLSRLSHVHVFWWHDFLTRFPLREGEAFWTDALARAARTEAWPRSRWAFLEHVRGDEPDQLSDDADALLKCLADQADNR